MYMDDRRALRERFDDGDHVSPQGMPVTHRRHWYLATDGSMRDNGARLGAILETTTGQAVGRWYRHVTEPDNNAAEVAALHFGLDRAAEFIGPRDRIGILLDHDGLASAMAACVTPGVPSPRRPPCQSASPHHWGGIRSHIAQRHDVRVALVDSGENPAHVLASDRVW